MTTLILQAADTALGGLANMAGAYAGQALTGAILGSGGAHATRMVEGPRLTEMNGLGGTEGAPIPRVYGRARIGGQLIWATRFEEAATTTVERQTTGGGKSLGSPKKTATTVSTTYSYHANLAIGLCEGPIAFVRRIWADGREVDQTRLAVRVHTGGDDQEPDPLIVAKEGGENAPAYRGLAYVVFERMPLAEWGNRVPQFSFEVVRPVDGLRQMIRSVCLIPGASEFGYDLSAVSADLGLGASSPENTHQFQRSTDVAASLDWMGALCPNLRHVSLVVSWFGDDLRAGSCTVAPRVEVADKTTAGATWSVAGLSRTDAREVSRAFGHPAYGGTPSDDAVVRLIGELKARGLAVTLYPFVMMDVPAGNDLPDPRTGGTGQPPYPWRGRITCDPAPGRTGSPDGTGAAADQVSSFFTGGEWNLRRLLLHCADLAGRAGGVDAFVIGSELVGLTRIRSAPGVYPAVAELRSLAGELRSVLGPGTKLTYAADWTEYGAHVLAGGAEVRFPLDPLWGDAAIDAVGIDLYAPLSDWRDGPANADAALGRSVHDVDYLRGRAGAGEAFDWYYASDADRDAQVRTPIADGAYGKPWTFRAKDLAGWWSNAHVERSGGVEIGATGWVPHGKPIWLTELGIPAVDRGTNGPNVFPDPKSIESAVPPFSRGTRDDLVQARGLEAMLSRFDPDLPGHQPGWNPVSAAYGGRMVEPARVSVWAWDARPFPAFPDFGAVWADGGNWQAGHWITGRIEGAPLDRLVSAITADYGLGPTAGAPLDGFVDGYVVDRPMSARSALEPLARVFGFDAVAATGGIRWRGRGGRVAATLRTEDLAAEGETPVLSRTRAQETELPASLELGFTDGEGEYGRAAVGSRRLAGTSRREASLDAAIVTRRADAQRLADICLQDAWAGRETCEFALSTRSLALEVGDVVSVEGTAGPTLQRITRIVDGAVRRVSTVAVEPAIFEAPAGRALSGSRPASPPLVPGRPAALILDLPGTGGASPALQYGAVAADPWPGAAAIWRAEPGGSFTLHALAEVPALIGRTVEAFASGATGVFDRTTSVVVEMSASGLSSIDDAAALGGGNLFAVRGTDAAWEVFSAARAELVGPRTYRLRRMLRGLGGTERLAARTVPSGAPVVRLDAALVPLSDRVGDLGRSFTYRIGPAGRDHADPSYVSLSATIGRTALTPLSPVHARARRVPDGIRLDWIRRTRIDGDNWDLAEVPLGEEVEAYEVDILDGDLVLRVLTADAPGLLYPAGAEAADFDSPRTGLRVRIAQLSAAVGRGEALAIDLPVP